MNNLGPSNQSEAYFNGSSYVRLATTISLKKQTGLSFKTCNGGSLFSQQQNNDLIQVDVNQEGVIFYARTNGKVYEEKIYGDFLDNKWHTVYLQYRLGNLTIEVDRHKQLIANSTYRNELLTSPTLYNEESAVLLIGKQFNGCLLEGPSIVFEASIITSSHNVLFESCPIPMNSCTPREREIDYCATKPCMSQGTCVSGKNAYSCNCLPRFTGKNCEFDLGNPCEKKPAVCKNSAKCISNPSGAFTCVCAPGFIGRWCEHEIKVHARCKTNPCLNGGTCDVNAEDDTVECVCRDGYAGNNCEINVDECASDPCFNGGICSDGYNNFTCDCGHTGYKGKLCEVNIDECLAGPCLNGGTCFDTYGSYLCQCLQGFDGKNCQFKVDECESRPCFNHGVCVSFQGGYKCNCLPGYMGEHCEIEQRQQRQCDCPPYSDCVETETGIGCRCKDEYPGEFPNCKNVDPCANEPCKNGATCVAFNGRFNCTCPTGFAGSACQRATLCKPNMCRNGGKCVQIRSGYYCECKNMWTGSFCEERVRCSHKPCKNGVGCRDFFGGYYCTCKKRWSGINCDRPVGMRLNGGECLENGHSFTRHRKNGFTGKLCQIEVDGCASNPCLHGGKCAVDKSNSARCNCTGDWTGPLCERPRDVCELAPCLNNGTCLAAPNGRDFACTCPAGFGGPRCDVDIDDCEGVRCPGRKACADLVDGYECRCPPGYEGENCEVEVDPCGRYACHNGTCVVDGVTHKPACNCYPGMTGEMCTEDINECSSPTPKICNSGICVNTVGSFQCYCMPGFTGERCDLDFDECLSMPCKNNATCINLINNYSCKCPPGYEGKDCSENIDECADRPCQDGATCIDGINEFTCVCPAGMTGKLCEEDINDCDPSPCLNNAKCIDGLNSYTCDCTATGYEGDHCEVNIDDCKGNPCQYGAECIDKIMDYTCNCHRGYTGKNCEVDINECESGPCQYNGICLEKSNITFYNPRIVAEMNITLPDSFDRPFNYSDAAGYECLCVAGVTGPNCEININECESNPCLYGGCVDKIGSYVCECDEGYEGQRCDTNIDECERYRPCLHGRCEDLIANYFCACDPNFGGKNCSVELIGCVNNPCRNSGECRPYLINENQHKFNCTCPNGYHGYTCEQTTTMSLAGNSLVMVNTTRDEGYDIQFRFKTTLGDGLLALGKGLTYYILELSRGRLNLHSSLLNKWEGVFIGSNLNDSNWQKVFVAINSTHLVLSANDEQTIYPITFNENYNGSSTSFPLTYIGGIPSNLRKLTHGQPFLVGCTEDVLINGEWVLPEVRNSSSFTFQNVDVGCVREPQCNPNPCHSGGHCTDKWRSFSCACERPYLGHTCQYNYTAATFGHENVTDSLVSVEVLDYARRAVRSIVDISMFIRTRQSKGQIFYLGSQPNSGDETYIAAQLESGELLVRIQFNGSLEAYTVSGVKLDNGHIHLIEVIRNVTLVQVKLNGTEYFRKTISATGTLDAQFLFLGGQPQSRAVRQAAEGNTSVAPPTSSAAVTSLSNVNFKGVLQDVQVSNGSTVMVVEFYPLEADDLEIPLPFGNVSFDFNAVLAGVRSDDACRDDPCEHNGMCEITWNDYRCNCTRGFKGKDCTELEFCELEGCPAGSECKNLEDGYECIANATFDGTQRPLVYNLRVLTPTAENYQFTNLELTYRTRSWGTVLFAKHLDNYFAVFVYHNEVVVQWQFAGVVTTRRFRKEKFEGQWLSLYFLYNSQLLRGGFRENVLDESPNFEVNDFDVITFTEIFLRGDVYVAASDGKTFDYKAVIDGTDYNMTGYIPVSDTTTVESLMSNSLESELYSDEVLLYKVDQNKSTDNFKGCLSEVRIGGLLLPYFTTEEIYPNESYAVELFELAAGPKPKLGCILCYDKDCNGEGSCINETATYKCNCNEGYAADDCSIDIDECESNQCKNNATCVDLVAKYECKCLPGYEGEYCETEIDECDSNPCRHGGTCFNLVGAFKCVCPENFVGKQCEAPLLITCENQPCHKGATCKTGPNVETGNNFTCVCTEGMSGVLCDSAFCMSDHCEQGYCNATAAVPFCQCQPGFEGKFCETNVDECAGPSGETPCRNGGECIDGVARYDCNCTGTGYTGLLCENDIDECKARDACGRNGMCSNLPGSYRCTCDTEGKCGHHCSLEDPCSVDNPCEHGSCVSQCTDVADYTCICEEAYSGKNCTETKASASRAGDGVNILYIVIPVVLVVVLGLLVALVVLVNVARSKRATRGTYSPSAQEFCNPRVELDHVLKPPPEERLI